VLTDEEIQKKMKVFALDDVAIAILESLLNP